MLVATRHAHGDKHTSGHFSFSFLFGRIVSDSSLAPIFFFVAVFAVPKNVNKSSNWNCIRRQRVDDAPKYQIVSLWRQNIYYWKTSFVFQRPASQLTVRGMLRARACSHRECLRHSPWGIYLMRSSAGNSSRTERGIKINCTFFDMLQLANCRPNERSFAVLDYVHHSVFFSRVLHTELATSQRHIHSHTVDIPMWQSWRINEVVWSLYSRDLHQIKYSHLFFFLSSFVRYIRWFIPFFRLGWILWVWVACASARVRSSSLL